MSTENIIYVHHLTGPYISTINEITESVVCFHYRLRAMDLSQQATLEHLHSIADFLKRHECLWRAHVVEFFHDRLWENIDESWWEDLKSASIEDLLCLPSGKIQNTWNASLKDFIRTAQSLSLFRQPDDVLGKILPGLSKPMISNVLRQGMNSKKLHEVEALSAVVNRIARMVQATHVVDVGAGQGYLAQVLSFEYGLPVVALDACAHHANVTNERSARIKKYYTARLRESNPDGCTSICGPQTATFCVTPGSSQRQLQHFLSNLVPTEDSSRQTGCNSKENCSTSVDHVTPSFVLVGLHACGDLSATMLQTYIACKKIKAVVTVGCCYNLLSEKESNENESDSVFGFPLSEGAKRIGLHLGHRGRDLACQSAQRWEGIGATSAIYNFQQHALRAGFQMVLHKYYPDVANQNPTIGRLGKARRRKQVKKHSLMKRMADEVQDLSCDADVLPSSRISISNDCNEMDKLCTAEEQSNVKLQDFIDFCTAAFSRLGVPCVPEEDLKTVWKDIESKIDLVGPYWSLRAVLGPILESYILLDRWLYLQEKLFSSKGEEESDSSRINMRANLVALFDPEISPRNMAIMAIRN